MSLYLRRSLLQPLEIYKSPDTPFVAQFIGHTTVVENYHHFAAIAGAGPLVGPVLAAQMGYLPGTLWLLAGVVLAGAVQDFMVLFISSRRNGASLGEMIKEEMGPVPGTIALFGCFLIMIIILAGTPDLFGACDGQIPEPAVHQIPALRDRGRSDRPECDAARQLLPVGAARRPARICDICPPATAVAAAKVPPGQQGEIKKDD